MAGYKNSILALAPKVFITFDGDAFDDVTRVTTAVPPELLDESGLNHKAILHNANNSYPGYRLGMPSQVKLEQFQQLSMAFGFYGNQPTAGVWEKAYLEIPHSNTDFAFPNDGKFSVVWSMNKVSDEDNYRSVSLAPAYNYGTLNRPVFKKAGVFSVSHVYPWSTAAYLNIECPGGKFFTWDLPSDYHNVDRHFALTWNTFTSESGDKTGVATLYVDGLAVTSATFPYYDTYPLMNVNSPILIGGVLDSIADHGDRNTSTLQIDQFSVFDKHLSANQIGKLFRKTLSYEDMIKQARPVQYWLMQDAEDPSNYIVEAEVGTSSVVAKCVGGASRVTRNLSGPDQIIGSRSINFREGGQLHIANAFSSGSPVISVASDYSVEFWFSATSNNIASLFSMTGTESPYNGIQLTLNMHNNGYRAGALQLQQTDEAWGSAVGNWNDGQFHHCVIVKRGNRIELWVDGIQSVNKLVAAGSSYPPGNVTMFGSSPGRLNTDGNVSHMAWYTYALQEQQITARAGYLKTYKIRGQVTLRGIPYRANVRLYSHFSGQLLQEIFSGTGDGEYLAELYDNRLVDIVVLNSQDPSIRYRVYGPVTPSEYEDLP